MSDDDVASVTMRIVYFWIESELESSLSQCDFHCTITVAENCWEFCPKTSFTILAIFACT